MKQIYENMVIIVLLFLSFFVHGTMIIANLEITSARNFHSNAIEEIQASSFNQKVINHQIDLAKKSGWELICTPYLRDDYKDMRVELNYSLIGLPIIGENISRNIVGYAR